MNTYNTTEKTPTLTVIHSDTGFSSRRALLSAVLQGDENKVTEAMAKLNMCVQVWDIVASAVSKKTALEDVFDVPAAAAVEGVLLSSIKDSFVLVGTPHHSFSHFVTKAIKCFTEALCDGKSNSLCTDTKEGARHLSSILYETYFDDSMNDAPALKTVQKRLRQPPNGVSLVRIGSKACLIDG
eukprot:scaffold5383_cov222-Amphora_coffeaeformis.AAC.11